MVFLTCLKSIKHNFVTQKFKPGTFTYSDFSKENIDDQGLYIHEMTHVWQSKSGHNVGTEAGPLHIFGDPYKYDPACGQSLEQYNLEQQGDIVRNYFWQTYDPLIAAANPGVIGTPQQNLQILQEFLTDPNYERERLNKLWEEKLFE